MTEKSIFNAPLIVWIIAIILFIVVMGVVGLLLHISGFGLWRGLNFQGYCDAGCVLSGGR